MGPFFTQILVPNPVVQSEKRNNEKYRFFSENQKSAYKPVIFSIILPANQLSSF